MLNFITMFISVLFLSLQAQAEMRLFEWTPGTSLAPLIIAVRDGETPQQAAQRYVTAFEHTEGLENLRPSHGLNLPLTQFRELSDSGYDERALLIANRARDLTLESPKVRDFKFHLENEGHRPYILPVAADLGFSTAESEQFAKLIEKNFSSLVPMGGADVDPSTYHSENTHSRDTNPIRDRFEIRVIQHFVRAQRGYLMAICRGAQITAVALGYRLIQDIPTFLPSDIVHAPKTVGPHYQASDVNYHPMQIKETRYNILNSVADKMGALPSNSHHHQAIQFTEGGPLELAAVSPDGIPEALEFKNGKGIILQFHPEATRDPIGNAIMSRMIQQKRAMAARSCRGLFIN